MNFSEMMELMLIKMTLDAAAQAKGEQMQRLLEEIGIQAEITFEIDVKAVDLDTLHAKMDELGKLKKFIEE